jgi:hypothetical protein
MGMRRTLWVSCGASLWHNFLKLPTKGLSSPCMLWKFLIVDLRHSIPFSAGNGHHILNVIQQEIYLAEMELGSMLTGHDGVK